MSVLFMEALRRLQSKEPVSSLSSWFRVLVEAVRAAGNDLRGRDFGGAMWGWHALVGLACGTRSGVGESG